MDFIWRRKKNCFGKQERMDDERERRKTGKNGEHGSQEHGSQEPV